MRENAGTQIIRTKSKAPDGSLVMSCSFVNSNNFTANPIKLLRFLPFWPQTKSNKQPVSSPMSQQFRQPGNSIGPIALVQYDQKSCDDGMNIQKNFTKICYISSIRMSKHFKSPQRGTQILFLSLFTNPNGLSGLL